MISPVTLAGKTAAVLEMDDKDALTDEDLKEPGDN